MKDFEKIGAGVAILVIVFGMGAGWNSLTGRIDRLRERMGALEKIKQDGPCLQILGRQISAIEKGLEPAQKKLEGLASLYRCVPSEEVAAAVTRDDFALMVDVLSETNAALPASINYHDFVRDLAEVDQQLAAEKDTATAEPAVLNPNQ